MLDKFLNKQYTKQCKHIKKSNNIARFNNLFSRKRYKDLPSQTIPSLEDTSATL